jgi:hypothetical protein
LSHGIQCQDGFHLLGPICCQRTQDRRAWYLLKCCFPKECSTCIPDCCSKWY